MNPIMEELSDEPILRLGINQHGRNVILSCVVNNHSIRIYIFPDKISIVIDTAQQEFQKDSHQFVKDVYDNNQVNILYIKEVLKLGNIKGVL